MPTHKIAKRGKGSSTRNKTFPTEQQRLRFKLARDEAGLDQTQLARKAKVDQSALSRWENGSRDMAALALLRAADALGVRVDWILTGHEPKTVAGRPAPFLKVDPAAVGHPDVDSRSRELSPDPGGPSE